MKKSRSRWAVSILAMLLFASLLVAFPGCFGGEPGVEEIWENSQEADNNINSYHMEIAILYENTDLGGGQIQTFTYDVNGNNVHATGSIFGQSFSEIIVVGGKQYSRTMGQEEWTEQAVTVNPQAVSENLGGFADLPAIATSSENLGLETVDGQEVYHLAFTLDPEDVAGLFGSVDPAQLSANAGGNVDVWVEKDTDYRIKYEALVRNVLITQQIGYGDTHLIINITNINEPVNINPPQ